MDSSEHDIEALRRQHTDLKNQIDAENRRHPPNEQVLKALKIRKLRIKDRITLMSSALENAA